MAPPESWITVSPEDAGFDRERLDRACDLCRRATETGEIPGISLVVAREGRLALNQAWGSRGPGPASPDTVWLIASVTKPVVCAGICLLVERGEAALDDPVSRFIPQFAGADRAGVTLRDLLTHSSGLPDMLPENIELRRRHAPPDEFVSAICATPLLFAPGTDVSYQSTGIALLGAVIERISGETCRRFLETEFFEPLGMPHCALGWRPEFEGSAARATLEADQEPSDWDWNSAYWRSFGAPWGGMFATAPEFARFLQMLLMDGSWNGRRYFGPAAVTEMTRNQTLAEPGLSDDCRRRNAWGLGWQLAAAPRAGGGEFFGSLLGAEAYGHLGATGTAVWNDPFSGVSFVFFSNRPGCSRTIGLVSSAVAGSVL